MRGLRVCDVDPFKKLVSVREAVWRGKVQTPKTNNAIRNIPIPVEIVGALRIHINGRTSGFVFTTKNGTPRLEEERLLQRIIRFRNRAIRVPGRFCTGGIEILLLRDNSDQAGLVKRIL